MPGADASIERPLKAATVFPMPWSSMSAATMLTNHRTARKARVASGVSMIILPC